jgi:hypothetical protein
LDIDLDMIYKILERQRQKNLVTSKQNNGVETPLEQLQNKDLSQCGPLSSLSTQVQYTNPLPTKEKIKEKCKQLKSKNCDKSAGIHKSNKMPCTKTITFISYDPPRRINREKKELIPCQRRTNVEKNPFIHIFKLQ